MNRRIRFLALLLAVASLLAACGGTSSGGAGNPTAASGSASAATAAVPVANGGPNTIVLGAYTTPREAYGKLVTLASADANRPELAEAKAFLAN